MNQSLAMIENVATPPSVAFHNATITMKTVGILLVIVGLSGCQLAGPRVQQLGVHRIDQVAASPKPVAEHTDSVVYSFSDQDNQAIDSPRAISDAAPNSNPVAFQSLAQQPIHSKTAQTTFDQEIAITKPISERQNAPSVLHEKIQSARNLELQQRWSEAISQYDSIQNSSSPNPFVLHRLAVLLDRADQPARSLPLYAQALEMDPANVELLCDFGFRCHCSGDSKLAEQYYRQALQVDPDHARTHNNLGVLLSQHQAIQPALEHFKMAGLSPTEAQHNLSLAQRPTR